MKINRQIKALQAIVLCLVIVSSTSAVVYALVTLWSTNGSITVTASKKLKVYSDKACSNAVTSIDLGSKEQGSRTDLTLYIRNEVGSIENLINSIAWATTTVSLISIGLFALSWALGSLLKGAPIPFREWKEWGNSLATDAIKSMFLLALWSSIASLITWIISVIASAA